MSYIKTNWQNKPNQSTPINAANLNHIEDGISNTYPVILYDNDEGSSSTITLSDNVSNYNFIEIYYFKDLNQIVSSKIYNPNGKAATLGSVTFYDNKLFLRAAIVDISETTITWRAKDIGWGTVSTSGNTISKEQVFKICQVIGYKY